MFDELIGIHEIIELKPGWFIRVPFGRRDMLWNFRFDPITLAIVAISVGGGLQALSMVQQGRAAREAGETQEAIAARNALLAERQAEAEQQAAVAEAKRQREEGEELLARQRALFAKGRVEISRGTPLAVVVDTAKKLEADRLNILREGAISAAQRKGQAEVLRLQGKAAKRRGRAAGRGAMLAAGGTILTSVGQAGYMKSRTS